MQRKRSYAEAMEEGSVYDLLETRNPLVCGAFNPNVAADGGRSQSGERDTVGTERSSDRLQSDEIITTANVQVATQNPSENDTPTDGASADVNTSVRIQIHANENGSNINHRKSTDRDLHIHLDDPGQTGPKNEEEDSTNMDKLIDEVFSNCAEYISNEDTNEKTRLALISTDSENMNVFNFNVNNATVISYNDATEYQGEGSPSSDSRESARNRLFSNNFDGREDYSDDLISRETHYDSDDILEYDGDANDTRPGLHRENSLIIPNSAVSDGSSILPISYTGRNSTRRTRKTQEQSGFRARRSKRVVFRNGETNIPIRQHISGRMGRFMKDMGTTLIECRWRWVTLMFSIVHFILWLSFALMFYLASYANGDLSSNPPDILCIDNGVTFTGIFTFSVETQVSIGYGEKSPTEECPETIFIMLMEVITGYALLGAMVGIVYAKIVRPEKNLEGVGFSNRAVVCMRDGKLCLVIRVWDTQQKHVVGTRVSGWLIRHGGPTNASLTLSPQNPLVMWPTTLQHTIDENSPLYDMSAKDLIDQRFEVVITLTGSSRITGQMTQSRTSYLPQDILWGQRFKNVMSYNGQIGSYVVDRKLLNKLTPVDTPLCSARLLRELTEHGPSSPIFLSTPSSPPSTLTSPGWSFRTQFKPIIVRKTP